jgi:hypothetical protein
MRNLDLSRIGLIGGTLLSLFVGVADASVTLENFESGSFPSGWLITHTSETAWDVGGTIGNSSVSIDPAEGSFFARSGGPSTREAATGTARSKPYVVSFTMLEWLSTGWSGQFVDDGKNYFEILDSSFSPLATVSSAQSDLWETASVNLIDIGLTAGATFYFQAVDKRDNAGNTGFSWIAFDKLTLTGDELEIPGGVPEAASVLIWGLLGLTFVTSTGRRRSPGDRPSANV